jgi:hypothetical protein
MTKNLEERITGARVRLKRARESGTEEAVLRAETKLENLLGVGRIMGAERCSERTAWRIAGSSSTLGRPPLWMTHRA